jgi:hypothetical protein
VTTLERHHWVVDVSQTRLRELDALHQKHRQERQAGNDTKTEPRNSHA